MKKLFFSFLIFIGFLLLLLGFELGLRALPPSPSFSRLLFFNQFKISRWDFLTTRKHQLNVKWILDVIAQENADYYEEPEPDRPAFDRIPKAYHIKTNRDGFRDSNFPRRSIRKSVVLIGDSVGFGKGVAEQQRFFSILEKEFPRKPFYNLSLQGCTADCMASVLERNIDQLNPMLIIVQTSSNDIDQTLWREGVEQKIEKSPDIKNLERIASSYLLQKIQELVGEGAFSTLNQNSLIADQYYEDSVEKIFQLAKKKEVKVISLNLPFAYQWNYGGHISRACAKTDTCVSDLKFQFPSTESTYSGDDFATRTSQELGLSQEMISLVFPNPEYFLDVVHLTDLGHAKVATGLRPLLEQHLR
jgi:hypothetical protein